MLDSLLLSTTVSKMYPLRFLFLSLFYSKENYCLNLISFFIFLKWISEAAQIALESCGLLLAPEALVQRIEKDLIAIRAKYPIVADIHHDRKWEPGEIVISDVTEAKLNEISESAYGPTESNSLFEDSIFIVEFSKPYNNKKLAEKVKEEFGVEAVPHCNHFRSQSITLTTDTSGRNVYVFWKGWGDCRSGCIHNHFWTFTTGEDNSFQLVEEKGDNIGSVLSRLSF